MAENLTGFPKRRPEIVTNDDADAPSFLNPMDGEVFVTNRVGFMVMELADGTRSVGDIVSEVLGRFAGAPEDAVRIDIENFLKLGEQKGLIEWTESD